jgi:hypothetical protein
LYEFVSCRLAIAVKVIGWTSPQPCLLIADMDHFVEPGEMIQLAMQDCRVRMAIDVGAASRARLKINSKLRSLTVAAKGNDRSARN